MKSPWSTRYSMNMQDYPGYAIGKLLALIEDPEIISLAGGLPSPRMFLQSELVEETRRCFSDRLERVMQYSTIRGEKDLIEAVIAFLRRDGIRVAPENVMITTSAQQGLDLAGRLFLDPGDAVVLERPTFGGAIAAFQMQRPEFLGVELTDDGLDIDRLETLLKRRDGARSLPKFIYVVPDFQNPSGVTMGLDRRRALLDLAERFDVPVVEDSPYRTLRYRGADIPSLFALDQQRSGEHVIGIYTFSKLFCPGMRVGFTIGPPEVIERMTRIKEGGTLCTPKYNQDMCTAFLTRMDLDGYFTRCREYYGAKMETLLEALTEQFPPHRGISWTRPEGGMFLWVSLPRTVDTRQFFHEALAFRVAFVPGEAFYAERHEHHHMRVNFSFPSRKQLGEAIRRLSDCLMSRSPVEKKGRNDR